MQRDRFSDARSEHVEEAQAKAAHADGAEK